MRHAERFAAAAVVSLIGLPLAAADWPQWRGPSRDGRSAETGLLAAWPAAGPPLAWKSSGLGTGFSSLAIAGGRIYTLGDLADGQYLIALKGDGGAPLWKTKLGPIWEDEYPGPRATPTVDGDRVYALGTEGDLVAADAASGKELWRRNLRRDFGGEMSLVKGNYHWKFSESPLVDGGRVIVTPGAKNAALVALDRATGKEVWRTALPELGPKGLDGAAYSSAVISQGGGVRQVVQLLGRGLVGVDAANGRYLWGYNKVANEVANIPTPLVSGDLIFTSTGYQTGAALLRLLPDGKGIKAEEVYFLPHTTFQNHHGNMILHDGHVYAGSGHNKGFPVAVELRSGKLAWGPEESPGQGSAAVAYADGKVYLRYQNGLVVLADASPAGFSRKGSFQIPDVKLPSWSHPVISGGKLYLREQDTLYVYDLTPKKAT